MRLRTLGAIMGRGGQILWMARRAVERETREREIYMRVEESIEINRPLEEVFGYMANPENLPEWTGLVVEVGNVQKSSSDQLQEGDAFTLVAKFLGRRFETPYERTSYEPDRHFKERAAGGPIPDQEWTYTFEEVSEGATRLTRAVEGEPGGFFKLADPLIERALKRQVRNDLETLKDLLEAR
jgi:uncharacterized membrane protein